MPTALIVEDEPEANKLLALLVQLRGYSTDSAYTGAEALEKVREHVPDIVFLDLMLPDINGYEVCRRLKARKTTCMIPVVMVTARIAAENRRESFCVGADDYIPKPYTPDQIFRAMEDADAWRRECGREPLAREGTIALRPDSDEPLRQLALLRNFLVARTPLDVESVCRIGEALQALRSSAERWTQLHPAETPASVAYQILPDRITLQVDDTSGWLVRSRGAPGETWGDALEAAGFDAVDLDADGGTLRLVREFGP